MGPRRAPGGSSRPSPSERLDPIPDHPALLLRASSRSVDPTLVVADLHIGLPHGDDRSFRPVVADAEQMAAEIVELGDVHRVDRVVVAGDSKHPIVGVPRPLRPVLFDFFATLLAHDLEVDVVLGNHDVGLAPELPREVQVHPATGLRLGSTAVLHGHRWPSDDLLDCSQLVVGHLHPGYRLAPTAAHPGEKSRCWVRSRLPEPPTPLAPRTARATDVIVLPAFHPLAGAEALNVEKPKRSRSFLVHRFLGRGESRAYLLDGTDVGPVLTPPRSPPSAAAPGSSPAR